MEEDRQSAGASGRRPFFRPEVLQAQQDRAFGTVLYIQPLSATVLMLAAVAVALGFLCLLFYGEYTRKAHVKGYLVPASGLIKVHPLETGTIVEKHVVEGQRVRRGEPLFVVSMERRSGETRETQATAIAQLRGRRRSLEGELSQQDHLATVTVRALRRRITAMEAELAQIATQIVTQEQQMTGAAVLLRRYEQLRAQGLASEEMVETKRTDFLDQQGKWQALQRDRLALARELETLRADVSSTEIKASTQRGAIQRDISALEQQVTEYESRRTVVVTAPADGVATAVLADLGYTTNPSQPLVSILPAGAAMEAHLLVPTEAVGLLVTNQVVFLRYDAFPYQRFGSYRGRILEISRTLILPNEAALPLQPSAPVYRVTVRLDSPFVKAYGQEFPLQAGMLLEADVWLDRRRLYQWLLDPIYSVTGRV